MGNRLYTAVIDSVAVSAAQDLFEIVAPSAKACYLHSCIIAQKSDTDSEQLRVRIRSGQSTSGSGGNTVTPVPLDPGDAASGITSVEINNTTQASGGTIVTHLVDAFNVLNGWPYVPIPEHRICIVPGRRLTVEFPDAPTDALTVCATLTWEEIG